MKLAEKFLNTFSAPIWESKEVEDFLRKFKDHFEKHYNKEMKNPDLYKTIGWKKGQKYYSVWMEDKEGSGAGGRSQYMFIDQEGNIYKAAGWGKPAKGVRGNIATLDLSKIGWNTGWLYR